MRDQKILFIHHGRVVGGAPTSLKNTILGLKAEGFSNLKILCTFPDMKSFFKREAAVEVGDIYSPYLIVGRVLIGYAKIYNWLTFILFSLELMKAPISIFRQIRTFRREQPDVVHLNSSILILTAISARLAGIQLVWHVREVLLGSRFNLRRRFAGWIIRTLAHRVICISEVEATRLGKDRKGTVNVIYNFIDFSQFFASDKEIDKVKKQFDLKDKPTYLSLGGVSFRKGTVEIILAAQQMPNAHFVIAGTASSSGTSSYKKTLLVAVLFQFEDLLIRWRLKSYYSWFYDQRVSVLCREKEVPNLHFVGRLNFVPPIIAASDAIIFAGRTPHFPRPVYEAWALQKPVVVFDMEGISSNIKDGADGVICKRNDAQGLIDGLGKISVEMGRKGQEKAATRFDMQTNIRKIIEVYGDLI